MGLFKACNGITSKSSIIYIICTILFMVIGILYEMNEIERTKEYEKESVWWYGFIIASVVFIFVVSGMVINFYLKGKKHIDLPSEVWFFSHVSAYFLITFVSPGQWPFWLALSLLWEWIECYTVCFDNYGSIRICGGSRDIIANIAGISMAMWIHNSYEIEGLYKRNSFNVAV